MSHSQLDHLIRMINQISANNRAYEDTEAAQRVADHIKRFWARSMKAELAEYYQSGGAELSPISRHAVELLGLTTAQPENRISAG